MDEKQAPNMSGEIESLVGKYSNEWQRCFSPDDDGAFCRAVVREINAINPRFGLNAKRDGPSDDNNKDAITYYIGPTDRHVEVYDFIIGHEAAGAHIGWNDTTNYRTMGNPGTARFVHPVTGGGYDGNQTQPPPPVTGDVWTEKHEAIRTRLHSRDTEEIAGQLCYSFPGEIWGQKRAGEGRAISNDTIARKLDNGQLYAVRVVGELKIWGVLDSAQIFKGVSAVNHLGDSAPPPPPPPIEPPPESNTVTISCVVAEQNDILPVGTRIRIVVG